VNAIQYAAFEDELEKIASRLARLRTALSKGKQAVKKNPGKSLLAAYIATPGSFVATGAGIGALADAVSGKESKGPTGKKFRIKKPSVPTKSFRRKSEGEEYRAPKDFDWERYDKTGVPRLKPEPTPSITPTVIYPDKPGAPVGLAQQLRNEYFEILRRRHRV
jgi:hypothetical protein